MLITTAAFKCFYLCCLSSHFWISGKHSEDILTFVAFLPRTTRESVEMLPRNSPKGIITVPTAVERRWINGLWKERCPEFIIASCGLCQFFVLKLSQHVFRSYIVSWINTIRMAGKVSWKGEGLCLVLHES